MITTLVLFLFGAAIGSFLNVVAGRYEPDKRLFDFKVLGGRSQCPKCDTRLRWYELIPLLSFLIQLGRCRACRAPISLEYPIIEVASGLVLAFLPQRIFEVFEVNFARLSGDLPLWYFLLTGIFVLVSLALILISAIDFRLRIIPDQSNVLIAVLGLAAIIIIDYHDLFTDISGSFIGHYALLFGWRENIWINHLAGAVFGLIFFGLIIFFSRGRGMGVGDLKLAGAAGLLLGWPDIAVALALAFIVGAIGSIILLVRRTKGLKSAVPFGPFIALGILLVLFFGQALMDGYFALFP